MLGHAAVGVPCLDQHLGQQAASLDEERARAHRRVADLQVEDLLRRGGVPSSPRSRSRIGPSVVRTIGSVSERGV